MATEVFFGLGSNVGDRYGNIEKAVTSLAELVSDGSGVIVSSLFETAPAGFVAQPAFVNAACRLRTALDVFELMAAVMAVQARFGPRPAIPNGPRAIDVDVLMFGRLVVDMPGIQVPHPRMAQRDFVLAPLAEIAPGRCTPCSTRPSPSCWPRYGVRTARRRRSRRPPRREGRAAAGWGCRRR